MRNKAFYFTLLRAFVASAHLPEMTLYADDPLSQYLWQTMSDDDMRRQVLSDDVASRIFVDSMMQLVSLYLQKANYHEQRLAFERRQIAEAREWSKDKRSEEWASLLKRIEDKYREQGFSASFYQREMEAEHAIEDDALWQSLLNDWDVQVGIQIKQNNQRYLESRMSLQTLLLRNNLQAATAYVRQHGVGKEHFFQSWALMGGRWNALEYERLQAIVDLQKRYPILEEVARRMGRVADALGLQHTGYTSGRTERMEHASHSDIAGVSLGRDFSSLLPLELAQFSDEEMEDCFFQKYVTGRLQTFSYQSESLHAARSLHQHAARPRGPMVVCMDTSGSMEGLPNQIALSLMMKLTEMCSREQRDCELIAFSVLAKPIDVMDDRTKLLQFFTSRASGDTDARRMLRSLSELFTGNQHYASADVLWISDFRIPLPDALYLSQMEQLRSEGTCFYGLQIGIAENRWTAYFDEMFQIYDYQ